MYEIGDKIVYPMHGAGVVKDIEKKEIFDTTQMYYLMEIVSEGMEILIPVDKADEVGVRDIVTSDVIEKMLDSLEEPSDQMNGNWSKRYQDNMDILKSGDIFDVAKVVKNLTLLDRKKGLSTGEKKMLTSARNFLISEMVLVQGRSKEESLQVIEEKI